MSTKIVWHDDAARSAIIAVMGKRLDAAARYLKSRLREEVSRKQLTSGKGARRRGLNPSAPGEYPKMVTTHFRRSIDSEFDPESLTARVGTNLRYGKYLQLGTGKMSPRPWLSLGLQKYLPMMRNILTHGKIDPGGGK